MELIVTYKNVHNDRLCELYEKNYSHDLEFTPEYRYSCVMEINDMWFHLVKGEDIIACCSILIQNEIYNINDVYVEEKFRGNNYAYSLLLNVLSSIGDKQYSICASLDNIPAIKTYQKIFNVTSRSATYIYFSL